MPRWSVHYLGKALGTVDAPDKESAIAETAKQFEALEATAQTVMSVFTKAGYEAVAVHRDLVGRDRVLVARCPLWGDTLQTPGPVPPA